MHDDEVCHAMPYLHKKSSKDFETNSPLLSVLRTSTTCSDCLSTTVFHSLKLANTLFFALSIYTKILCEKLSMNVRKYLVPPMNIVFISLCTSECTSSKIVVRVPLLVGNGLLTCLPTLSRGFLKLRLFELQLAASLWPWQSKFALGEEFART